MSAPPSRVRRGRSTLSAWFGAPAWPPWAREGERADPARCCTSCATHPLALALGRARCGTGAADASLTSHPWARTSRSSRRALRLGSASLDAVCASAWEAVARLMDDEVRAANASQLATAIAAFLGALVATTGRLGAWEPELAGLLVREADLARAAASRAAGAALGGESAEGRARAAAVAAQIRCARARVAGTRVEYQAAAAQARDWVARAWAARRQTEALADRAQAAADDALSARDRALAALGDGVAEARAALAVMDARLAEAESAAGAAARDAEAAAALVDALEALPASVLWLEDDPVAFARLVVPEAAWAASEAAATAEAAAGQARLAHARASGLDGWADEPEEVIAAGLVAAEVAELAEVAKRAAEEAALALVRAADALATAQAAEAACGGDGAEPDAGTLSLEELAASPLGAEEGTPEGMPRVPLGVNGPKVYAYEASVDGDATTPEVTKYGDLAAVLGDVPALGATFFRQPNPANLTWPGTVDVPVGLESGGTVIETEQTLDGSTRATRNDVYWALHGARWAALRAMFEGLRDGADLSSQKVALTLLTVGYAFSEDARDLEEGVDVCACDEYRQYEAATVVGLRFPTDHATRTVLWWNRLAASFGVPDYATELDASASATICVTDDRCGSTPNSWDTRILDPRSKYKLRYAHLIGQCSAQLLLDLDDVLGAGTVFDRLLALEIGNELDKDWTLFVDDTASEAERDEAVRMSARWTARLVREVARGVYEVLAADARWEVALWLPGLSPYQLRTDEYAASVAAGETPSQPTFADVARWNGHFLAELLEVADEDGLSPAFLGSVTGQDYHVYSYALRQGPGPIARLRAELDELQAQLDAFAAGVEALGVTPADVRVMVLETGASSMASDVAGFDVGGATERWEDPFPYVSARFAASDGDDDAQADFAELFQARDLWRRVLVAAASGASRVAWHTAVGGYVGEAYAGTGLRQDYSLTDETRAAYTTRKLAWWSYRRLVDALVTTADGVAGLSARILHLAEEPGPRGWDDLNPTSVDDMLVVVEISPAAWAPWAYVILLDPSASADLRADVCVVPEGAGEVVALRTVPGDGDWFERTAEGTDVSYPTESATGGTCDTESPSGACWSEVLNAWTGASSIVLDPLQADADPVLLLSSVPLSFRVERPS